MILRPVSFRAALAALALLGFGAGGAQAAALDRTRIIVAECEPASSRAEASVRSLGGTVTRQLPIVGGFAAVVPRAALAGVRTSSSIRNVWPDARIRMNELRASDEAAGGEEIPLAEYDPLPPNTVWPEGRELSEVAARYDGTGVTVAVIDTGVYQAPDLQRAVQARLDFTPGYDGIDRFGHGTHMAGIVAGDGSASSGRWKGVAPGSRIVALKVAGPDGATDVSVVLAALQWTVAHKDEYGIRVVNLSFGTDSQQSTRVDPVGYAVERAWKAGLLVVAAAGNRGPGKVDKPGDDPYVVTVGAADLKGTEALSDDAVAPFSGYGPTQDGLPKPDLVAPGIAIVSSRVPNGTIDRFRPAARVGAAYFKGTGTSQAAAVVSGVAALLFQANPKLTPDQAKAALVQTTAGLRDAAGAGAGLVDVEGALAAALDPSFLQHVAAQRHAGSSGRGSIDSSRGSFKPYAGLDTGGRAKQVSGEIDVFGKVWDTRRWTSNAWTTATWRTSAWASLVAPFPNWQFEPWRGSNWSGLVWESDAWTSKAWSDSSWPSKAWSSKAWSTWN